MANTQKKKPDKKSSSIRPHTSPTFGYPKEAVVAEKFEAMVKLGLANSRMKDFFDLMVISRTFPFDGESPLPRGRHDVCAARDGSSE